MSGPQGSVTKRDQRRETRRQQYETARRQRQIEVQRQLRRKRLQRGALYLVGALVVIMIAALIIHAATGANSATGSGPTIHSVGTYTAPALGETRDGMPCYNLNNGAEPSISAHYHAYLEMYVNGKPYDVPANTGIPAALNGAQCIYPLHIHPGENNIIHIETQSANTVYTLGAFFDIWGQPLSTTQVGSNKADATHKLVFEYFDANGKLHPWTGNPLDLPLKSHETVVILYNSPNTTPTAYTNWNGL
jgi:hypothetical protein